MQARRVAEVQAHVGHVERVAGHVAQRAGAERPPAAPLERVIGRVIGPHFRRADELWPVHGLGHFGRVGGPVGPLRPDRAVGPDVNFLDLAQRAGLQNRGRFAEVVVGGALVAHLRGEVLLGGQLPQHAGFVQRLGHRLLDEGVLAHPHAHRSGDGVGVVGRADGHGVDALAHLVEHLAEVEILLRVGPALARGVEAGLVDVADRDHVAGPAGILRIAGPLAADADAGEVDLFQGRAAFARSDAPQSPITGADGRGRLHEAAASRLAGHFHSPWRSRNSA